jgi:DNA end-binding protein Ku
MARTAKRARPKASARTVKARASRAKSKTGTSHPRAAQAKALAFHAFWSGSLSFGLVNVPVHLFPATRHAGIHLRLIGPDGAPLKRRFYCREDGREVPADEIVRGHELDDGSYILVTDQELEDLEPQKSREIDLREFVDLADVAPAFLERGYYLTPAKDSTKAYRLLAEVMEKRQRAGIATFVMRDREYLIEIFARNGILCAETLRFQDEIRDPQAIDLAEPVRAPRKQVAAFERSIDALFSRTLPRELLVDTDCEKLRALIEKKQKTGKDLIRVSAETVDDDPEDEEDVDLLATIRESLGHLKKPRKTPKP